MLSTRTWWLSAFSRSPTVGGMTVGGMSCVIVGVKKRTLVRSGAPGAWRLAARLRKAIANEVSYKARFFFPSPTG